MSKTSRTISTIGKALFVGTISFAASNAIAQASDINWMSHIKETKAKIEKAENILRTYNPQTTTYQQAARDLPVLQKTLSWDNAEADKKAWDNAEADKKAWDNAEADKKARSRGYVPNSFVKKSGYDHNAELSRLGVREGVPSPYSAVPPYPPGTKPVEHSLWNNTGKGFEEYGRHVLREGSGRGTGPLNGGVESFSAPYRPATPLEAYSGTTGYTKLLGQMRNQITSFPDELIHHILPGDFTPKYGSNKVVTGNEKMLYIREQLFDLYHRLNAAKGEEAKKAIVASFEKTSGISETRLTAAFAAREAMFERDGARQAYRDSLMSPEQQKIHREKVEAMMKADYLKARQYDDKVRIALNENAAKKFPELSATEYLKAVTTKTGQVKAGALKAWIERAGFTKITKASGSMGILGLAIAATASSAANAGEAQSENEDSAPAKFSRKEFRTHRTSN